MPATSSLRVNYLGRFSRGQYVVLVCSSGLLPADVPVVDIWRNGAEMMREVELPRIKAPDKVFRLSILMDEDFTDGVYSAVCRMEVNGVQKVVNAIFEVVGGEGLSPLISVTEIDRALGRAIVSQSAAGTCKIGYKPRRRN